MEIIRLQQRRILSLSMGASETQIETAAANVLRYKTVTPFIRVVRDPANALNATGIRFSFLTAALLATADDSAAWGTRFKDIDYTIDVTGISGATVNGNTFTKTPASGKIPYIEAPGGLLLWKASNLDSGNSNTVVFEIDLVCRED